MSKEEMTSVSDMEKQPTDLEKKKAKLEALQAEIAALENGGEDLKTEDENTAAEHEASQEDLRKASEEQRVKDSKAINEVRGRLGLDVPDSELTPPTESNESLEEGLEAYKSAVQKASSNQEIAYLLQKHADKYGYDERGTRRVQADGEDVIVADQISKILAGDPEYIYDDSIVRRMNEIASS